MEGTSSQGFISDKRPITLPFSDAPHLFRCVYIIYWLIESIFFCARVRAFNVRRFLHSSPPPHPRDHAGQRFQFSRPAKSFFYAAVPTILIYSRNDKLGSTTLPPPPPLFNERFRRTATGRSVFLDWWSADWFRNAKLFLQPANHLDRKCVTATRFQSVLSGMK